MTEIERERERGTRISLSAVSPGLNESVVDDGGGSATVPEGAMGGLSLVEQSRTTNLFRVLTRLLLVPLFLAGKCVSRPQMKNLKTKPD